MSNFDYFIIGLWIGQILINVYLIGKIREKK